MKKICVFLFLLLLTSSALAQETPEANLPQDQEYTVPTGTLADQVGAMSEMTIVEDKYAGEYAKSSPQNLSKLYWRLHVFDDGDDRAVDNYMLLNECQIYQDNINNEFEWSIIRDTARKMLKQKRDTFPLKFSFILPVELGEYDPIRGGFPLSDRFNYQNIRRLEVTGNWLTTELCGKQGEIRDYPRNIMLILDKPFTYTFAKVDEHVAQAYILKKQQEVLNLDYNMRQKRYRRPAFLRLRVDIYQYQGNIRASQGTGVLAILQGKLQGIDMFEDYGETLMLSSSQVDELQ